MAARYLEGGLSPLWPRIKTVIVNAGYLSEKLTEFIRAHAGWTLTIVKRSEPELAIVGLNWIVERIFAWLGQERQLLKGYELNGANLRNLHPDRCLSALLEEDCQLIRLPTHPLSSLDEFLHLMVPERHDAHQRKRLAG